MRFATFLACGFGAGLLGSAAWALIAYFANLEVGWIAWIIGGLAGLGVRAAAKRKGGGAAAFAASIAAALCIIVGKVGAVAPFAFNPTYDAIADREILISYFADDVVFERDRAGATIDWPGGQRPEVPQQRSEYPADVWIEAEARWDALTDVERADMARKPARYSGDEYAVSFLADDVAVEYEERGRPLNYPAGADRAFGATAADYPSDVWVDALARWDAMPPEQQRHYRERMASPGGASILLGMPFLIISTLTRWDALWFGLAMVAAFRIGGSRTHVAEV